MHSKCCGVYIKDALLCRCWSLVYVACSPAAAVVLPLCCCSPADAFGGEGREGVPPNSTVMLQLTLQEIHKVRGA